MQGDRDQGAAAVEMALVMPLLFMLIFGIVVFGIALFRTQGMEAAVREGGRLAAVSASKSAVTARVQNATGTFFDWADLDLTLEVNGTAFTGADADPLCGKRDDAVTVGVKVKDKDKHGLDIPFVGTVAPDYGAEATFRCEG